MGGEMTERARMPNRRQSFRRKFKYSSKEGPGSEDEGMMYFGTVSFYIEPEWAARLHQTLNFDRPYEVFIDCAKSSSDAAFAAEAAAIYASLALQYGCPLKKLVDAGPKLEHGKPAEPVGFFLRMVLNKDIT